MLAKNMYRWIDEHGNVKYSDQVPPDQVKHRRESLSDSIRVVDVIDKEKSKAQRELEKRLAILRREQEKIISKQKSHDKVLLSTFRNLEDMKMAMKGKMLALDGQIKMVQGNLSRLVQQLQQQQKKAAQHERDGKAVPAALVTVISRKKDQIETVYVEISRLFEKKKRVREEFETDMQRFSFLTKTNNEGSDLSRKTAENKAESELGLFICESLSQCDVAWEIARQFATRHSTTELEIETSKLIMGRAPFKDDDLSLSVSKMDVDDNKQQLFLDIRCRNSSLGNELCRSRKAKKIRQSFSQHIKSDLAAKLKNQKARSSEALKK